MLNFLYYIKFGRISATPFFYYSLLYVLLLNVFFSTIWHLVEDKRLFLRAIHCCLLTIHSYISYVFDEVLLTKLTIAEYKYGYCKKHC